MIDTQEVKGMFDEGVIKYESVWEAGEPLSEAVLGDLMAWRDRLYGLGLIGAYENGIGFGNVSQRLGDGDEFVISGTQTGHVPHLEANQYTRVCEFDLGANRLRCCGPVKASSESLTHGAIYQRCPQVRAIFHVHQGQFWRRVLHRVPTTGAEVPYGTPQMAEEMFRLFEQENLSEARILAMAGHEDGVMSFGESLDQAGAVLLRWFEG
ncbi:class II aldolase/adducin family protein [Sodalinema gerasimenkoae]|uniref:class II aldolase/adducin family protein n=1 Tax=Sodalinema gerasimenkoae TaxID=2862348 RepID=UPI001FE2B976|nr:class II aldolase/adducin family protein [Sodalinema gerasimenkoae]